MSCIAPSVADRRVGSGRRPDVDRVVSDRRSTVEELAALGWELNANLYRVVHLAARYDEELDWFHQGFKSSPSALGQRLQLQPATAREWVRVGYMLREFPLIDAAFEANEISYAKARILTRWADADNEAELLALAERCSASRLTTAIARLLAADEDDDSRDSRHHDARSLTSYTDGDGMVIIRIALPPLIAKLILAAIEELVRRIAKIPANDMSAASRAESDRTDDTGTATCGDGDLSAVASDRPSVVDNTESATWGDGDLSAVASGRPSVVETPASVTCSDGGSDDDAVATDSSLTSALAELAQRWQPQDEDHGVIPTMAQQRADAFAVFFLQSNIDLTTEVVIHVRGDGNTLNDGTPITDNAVACQLDESFIRLLIHDAERRPVNASSRRRHPTARQEHVVLEMYNHECVDCAATDLLEFDHNPPYHQTRRTITDELQPRCAPCHRARHRTSSRTAPRH